MIRLGARLATTGRASLASLALTVIAVGIGSAVLLFALSLSPAMDVRFHNTAWRAIYSNGGDRVPTSGLLIAGIADAYRGSPLLKYTVAPLDTDAPLPPGVEALPGPGESVVSPALARLIASVPADELGNRFGTVVGMIGDEALKGPDELVAFVGSTPAAMTVDDPDLGHVLAGSVSVIDAFPTAPNHPEISWALILIVALAVVGALAPVVVFVGTATRLSAARREQRLATLRLIGATNRQMSDLAIGEALAATIPGALVGVLLFLLTRPLVALVPIDQVDWFSDSIMPSLWQAAAVLLVVQLLGVATAVIALRRLAVSPLGVARHEKPRPVTWFRLVPLPIAVAGFAAGLVVFSSPDGRGVFGIGLIVGSFVAIVVGIALAGPWLTQLIGRLLHAIARGPALLIASSRLHDAPRAAFGAISGVVLAVFVASAFFTLMGYVHAEQATANSPLGADTLIVDRVDQSTDGAAAASRIASTPGVRATALVRDLVLQSDVSPSQHLERITSHMELGTAWVVPCDDISPFLVVAECPTGQFALGAPGWTEMSIGLSFVASDTLGANDLISYDQVLIVDAASVPASVRTGGGTIAEILAQTDGDPASVERVRTTVEASHPDWSVSTPGEQQGQQFAQITEVGWIVILGTIGTLVMAGCSLAVAVAGGLVERRRPLALLRLTGMPLRRLRSIVLLEAAPPLLIAALASAVLGVVVADAVVAMLANAAPPAPDWALVPLLVLGIVLALGIVALTFPLLGRVTSSEATRFE